MIMNMTEGSPAKNLWKFSLPMLFSSIFQQLYNIVDSIIAGKFVGSNALASIGASYPIVMIFIAIASGLSIGVTVIVAQLFGAKRIKELKTSISTALISIITLSIILTIIGVIFCIPALNMLNTPQSILADSSTYLSIYVFGLPFLFLYNASTGIFNALGDSKTPLYLLIFSSVFNIALDILFVTTFNMGIAGVAWATFIAQGISSILAFIILLRRIVTIKYDGKYQIFSIKMTKRIAKMAVPSILQQSFISVGNLFIQSLVNSFGPSVIAGFSSAMKLNAFALTSFTTLSNGMSTFTAQSIGAKKIDRVQQGAKICLLMTVLISLPFILAYEVFGGKLMLLFTDSTSQAVIDAGSKFLMICAPFYALISIKIVVDGILRGSGAMLTFMVSTFADLLLRIIFAFILAKPFGSTGIWLSWPVGWVIATFISAGFYLSGVWKKPHNI